MGKKSIKNWLHQAFCKTSLTWLTIVIHYWQNRHCSIFSCEFCENGSKAYLYCSWAVNNFATFFSNKIMHVNIMLFHKCITVQYSSTLLWFIYGYFSFYVHTFWPIHCNSIQWMILQINFDFNSSGTFCFLAVLSGNILYYQILHDNDHLWILYDLSSQIESNFSILEPN